MTVGLLLCAEHGTNLVGASPVTGIRRSSKSKLRQVYIEYMKSNFEKL